MKRHIKKLKKNHLLTELSILLVALGFFTLGGLLFFASSIKLPDLDSFNERRISQSAKIYDRTGEILLYNFGENSRRTIVSGEAISRNIKNATVAIEDAEFYEHRGIKPTAIIRAFLVNVGTLGYSQGGSTITQQVVKNSLLTTEKTITRKIKEWVLSVKLERVLGKDQILEIYLNESPYGGSLYGVEEASLAFFGKHASDLSLAESAYLSALPQAPTYYSPYGNHKDKLEDRKNLVLSKLLENKFITEDEFAAAKGEVVTFLPQRDSSIKAPHFVFAVREYLEEKYGRQALDNGGLKITTTLDSNLQAKAEEIVKRYALENATKFNASNAALVAIDPKTGQVLVMVGSRDYFDKEIDGNFNVARANRQPGSSFKPFVYATVFKKGYTADTVLFDLKTQFSTRCEPYNTTSDNNCYSPDNYDNIFRGPISLRNALAQSINIPAVKTLYLAGITDSIFTARDMGITTLVGSDRYGLTLVLGGGEVKLLDMTSAYSVFGNDGARNPYTYILKVESAGGVLEEFIPKPSLALDSNIARTISDILSDENARAPAFGTHSALYFPNRQVAVKTGTTNDYRDAWIVGYTPSLSVGAWAGNNDNSPMEKKVAGFIVAPLWNAFMTEALKSIPNEPFPKPDLIDKSKVKPILRGIWQGGEVYLIDKFSQKLATENTPLDAIEERAVKNIHSILYWINRNDPNGNPPENPNNDSQFKYWEYAVRKWVADNNIIEETNAVIPKERDSIHTGVGSTLKLSGISPNQTYSKNTRLTLFVTGVGPFPLSRIDVFVNDSLVGSASGNPFSVSFVPSDVEGLENLNTLKVVGYDSVLNKSDVSVQFNVSP